ncbi:hypothetical protein, partial [Vibrio parahaemolyticus]|uniref:hypothetical protein n=1 Tax=Vibrio parahaemolyticus TaxID=670 RepID=UPI001C60F157
THSKNATRCESLFNRLLGIHLHQTHNRLLLHRITQTKGAIHDIYQYKIPIRTLNYELNPVIKLNAQQ